MSDNKDYARKAFAAVYNEDPATFNKIAQQAIKDVVREKIKTIRGEIRDELTNRLLAKDGGTTPVVAANVPPVVPEVTPVPVADPVAK